MNGPSFVIHSDDEDEIVTIDQNDLNKKPSFQFGMGAPPSANPYGADMLINPVKVSKEVISAASSSDSSAYSSDDTSSYETDEDPIPMRPRQDPMAARFASERSRQEDELAVKKDLLHKIDRLESRGYKLPKKFTIHDDLDEIQVEFDRVRRERDLDISVRFQSRMLVTAVTGIEVLNNSYDPFGIYLRGWSDQISSEIDDYHDIFVDLHDKYQSSNRKMAPELRLALSLAGSGFLYHLGNKVIKQSATPEVEDVLKSDPALMRQFQQAAAKRMGTAGAIAANLAPAPRVAPQAPQAPSGGMGNIFGNLLSTMMGAPPMPAPPQMQVRNQVAPLAPQAAKTPSGLSEIDDIIKEVSQTAAASAPSPSRRFETLSEDEDIISLVENQISDAVSNTSSAVRRGGAGRGRGRSAARTPAPPQRILNL